MIMLHKDVARNGFKHIAYTSLDNIIDTRLTILKSEDMAAFRMLAAMSVLGSKFYPAMLNILINNSPQWNRKIIEAAGSTWFYNAN